jgi:hypothetical protein
MKNRELQIGNYLYIIDTAHAEIDGEPYTQESHILLDKVGKRGAQQIAPRYPTTLPNATIRRLMMRDLVRMLRNEV